MRVEVCGALITLACCGRIGFDSASTTDALEPVDVDGSCGALTTLSDGFDDGVPSPLWTVYEEPGVSTQESAGRLDVILSSTMVGKGGYRSACAYDASNLRVRVQAVIAPNNAPAAEMYISYRVDQLTALGIVKSDSGLRASKRIGGTFMELAAVPYVAAQQRYWQLREAGGVMFWETSTDATSWDQLWTEPTPFDVSAVQVELMVDTFAVTANPGQGAFDDLLVP